MSTHDSASDFGSDDASSIKKREREPPESQESFQGDTSDTQHEAGSPKKTKTNQSTSASVRHIRKNLKDMTTDEKPTAHDDVDSMPDSQADSLLDSQDENDTTLGDKEEDTDRDAAETTMQVCNDKKRSIAEEQDDARRHVTETSEKPATNDADQPRKRVTRRDSTSVGKQQEQDDGEADDESTKDQPPAAGSIDATQEPSPKKHSAVFAAFAGKSKNDDDDWGEFAEDKTPASQPVGQAKPKYTFGASSDFGFKSWAPASQPSASTTTSGLQKPTFGGFSGSGFGGFSASATTTTGKTGTPVAFGSFANATSPFALAAAGGQTNVLASLPSVSSKPSLSESTSTDNGASNTASDASEDESDASKDTKDDTPKAQATAFGSGIKTKALDTTKPPVVTTGEEDEETVHRTKAKLFVLDPASGNWKERGPGMFRINTKTSADNTKQTRLVMRADSVYRVILNLPLFKGMKFFIMQDKFVRFAGFEVKQKDDGKQETVLVNYALKLSSSEAARDLLNILVSYVDAGNNGAAHV